MRDERVICRTKHLKEEGWSDWQIRKAVMRGEIARLRRGWYALGPVDSKVVTAVTKGGALSCISALGEYGVFVPIHHTLHIRRPERGHRQRGGCRGHGGHAPVNDGIDSPAQALRCAVKCMPAEWIVVIIESIRMKEVMTTAQILDAIAGVPKWIIRLLQKVDKGESGTETLVRLRLRALGIRLTCQVEIDGVGRVDMIIGDRLVIEVDGVEFHSSPEQFEHDRERDRRLTALGYTVVRLSYKQVMYGWSEALADILGMVRQGIHRRRRNRRRTLV